VDVSENLERRGRSPVDVSENRKQDGLSFADLAHWSCGPSAVMTPSTAQVENAALVIQ
jgi:hypothetical protein